MHRVPGTKMKSVKYEKKKAKGNEFLPRKVVDMRNQIENEGTEDRGGSE